MEDSKSSDRGPVRVFTATTPDEFPLAQELNASRFATASGWAVTICVKPHKKTAIVNNILPQHGFFIALLPFLLFLWCSFQCAELQMPIGLRLL
jgi:hypothetical protein